MIRHTVVFKLKHAAGSQEEKDFFAAAQKLALIPGIHNFECLRQISKMTDFNFGLSMEFDSKTDYDEYSNHPDHVSFVSNRWLKEVGEFLEIDYELLQDTENHNKTTR